MRRRFGWLGVQRGQWMRVLQKAMWERGLVLLLEVRDAGLGEAVLESMSGRSCRR